MITLMKPRKQGILVEIAALAHIAVICFAFAAVYLGVCIVISHLTGMVNQ